MSWMLWIIWIASTINLIYKSNVNWYPVAVQLQNWEFVADLRLNWEAVAVCPAPNNFCIKKSQNCKRYFWSRIGSYNQYVKIVIGTTKNIHKRTSSATVLSKLRMYPLYHSGKGSSRLWYNWRKVETALQKRSVPNSVFVRVGSGPCHQVHNNKIQNILSNQHSQT